MTPRRGRVHATLSIATSPRGGPLRWPATAWATPEKPPSFWPPHRSFSTSRCRGSRAATSVTAGATGWSRTCSTKRPPRRSRSNKCSRHAVFFEQAVQAAAVDSQRPRGACFIAAFAVEHVDHVRPLDLVELVGRTLDGPDVQLGLAH